MRLIDAIVILGPTIILGLWLMLRGRKPRGSAKLQSPETGAPDPGAPGASGRTEPPITAPEKGAPST